MLGFAGQGEARQMTDLPTKSTRHVITTGVILPTQPNKTLIVLLEGEKTMRVYEIESMVSCDGETKVWQEE